jgi:uncharacterized protein (TIGR00251 family)
LSSSGFARERDGELAFDVLVSPHASRARLGPVHGDRVKVAVTSPPVDGAANAAVIELVARALGVARGAVSIAAGQASRRKTVVVRGVGVAALEAAIAREGS